MAKDKSVYNPPWYLVILMLGVFWPVGLYFLWCKMQNLSGAKKRGRGVSNGSVFMALAGLFLLMNGGSGFGAFLVMGAIALFAYNWYLKSVEQKFNRYQAVIGDHSSMDINDIASAMGVKYDVACKDLQTMIDEQRFSGSAYLDLGRGLFVSHARYAPKGASPARAQAEPKPQPQAQPQPKPPEEENEYLKKLTQIRAVNEAIKDQKVSAQIERIEQITGNIFEIVAEHPEKVSQIHTFMNYYLPTTLKLLSTYAKLEKQGISGENIESSKRNIEGLMDQLVWAFEQQNDQMFAREALDINSDIKVMETMMSRDGLSESGLPKHPFAAATQKRSQ